jgi:2-keto-3-deoxy-6-phosphogluconate aldolase
MRRKDTIDVIAMPALKALWDLATTRIENGMCIIEVPTRRLTPTEEKEAKARTRKRRKESK